MKKEHRIALRGLEAEAPIESRSIAILGPNHHGPSTDPVRSPNDVLKCVLYQEAAQSLPAVTFIDR